MGYYAYAYSYRLFRDGDTVGGMPISHYNRISDDGFHTNI